MLERTTAQLQGVLIKSYHRAIYSGSREVMPEHALFVLIAGNNTISKAVIRLGYDLSAIRTCIDELLSTSSAVPASSPDIVAPGGAEPTAAQACQRMIALARLEADRFGETCVDDVHLMLAVMSDSTSTVTTVLASCGLDVARFRSELESLCGGQPQAEAYRRAIAPRSEEEFVAILKDLGDASTDVRNDAITHLQKYIPIKQYYAVNSDAISDNDMRTPGTASAQTTSDLRVAEAMLTSINDSNVQIRCFAALNLGSIAGAEAEDALIARLRCDTSGPVRRLCCSSLSGRESDASVDALMAALGDVDTDVQAEACISLGKTGNSRAVPAIRALLAVPSWELRLRACEALTRLRVVDDELIRVLEALCSDQGAVRYDANAAKANEFNRRHAGAKGVRHEHFATTRDLLNLAHSILEDPRQS